MVLRGAWHYHMATAATVVVVWLMLIIWGCSAPQLCLYSPNKSEFVTSYIPTNRNLLRNVSFLYSLIQLILLACHFDQKEEKFVVFNVWVWCYSRKALHWLNMFHLKVWHYFWYLLGTGVDRLVHILNVKLGRELVVLPWDFGIINLNKKWWVYNLCWFPLCMSFIIY